MHEDWLLVSTLHCLAQPKRKIHMLKLESRRKRDCVMNQSSCNKERSRTQKSNSIIGLFSTHLLNIEKEVVEAAVAAAFFVFDGHLLKLLHDETLTLFLFASDYLSCGKNWRKVIYPQLRKLRIHPSLITKGSFLFST